MSVSLAGASTSAADSAQIVFMDASLEKLRPLFDIADDLAINMRNNLIALVAPSPVILVGVYFLHFGYLATAILVTLSSVAGLVNAGLLPPHTRRTPGATSAAQPGDRSATKDAPAPAAERRSEDPASGLAGAFNGT